MSSIALDTRLPQTSTMRPVARTAGPAGRYVAAAGAGRPMSLTHRLSLFAVWVTIATSGVVFSEPAPVDALTMGLIILLPVVGLVRVTESLLLYLALWLVAAAGGFLATSVAVKFADATKFTAVSLYLYLASFVFAAFVAKRPMEHTRLIFSAWTVAAVIAALAGIIGYFSILPGAYDLFTRFGRAAGTFKDPNVFGPFLVVPVLYMLHLVVTRPLTRATVPLAVAGVLVIATLLSFSRGAWINLFLAVALYGWLAFVTSPTQIQRERILGILALGAALFAGLIVVAVQFDEVSELMSQRASLSQSYDVGPEGRFAGQLKAIALVAENPLGLGPYTFTALHHREDVHNVYVSIFLNAGWLGGGVYWIVTLLTLGLGFLHVLKARATRPLFIILYAAFAATAFEGLVIDTDHWRSFYLNMGLIWGLMAAAPAPAPAVTRGPAVRDNAGRRHV